MVGWRGMATLPPSTVLRMGSWNDWKCGRCSHWGDLDWLGRGVVVSGSVGIGRLEVGRTLLSSSCAGIKGFSSWGDWEECSMVGAGIERQHCLS